MKEMSDAAKEIFRLSSEGYCCSQIMVKMGLDAKQEENPELLDAVSGLCKGLYSGLCCGTLTGAACLLALYDKKNAASDMIPKLVDWFETTYTSLYGGMDCEDIIGDDPMTRFERCPKIMVETIEKCRELLAEFGYEI
jgi:hypothetical protein